MDHLPIRLAVVNHPHAGNGHHDDRRRQRAVAAEDTFDPHLVMIFNETHGAVLIKRFRSEMP